VPLQLVSAWLRKCRALRAIGAINSNHTRHTVKSARCERARSLSLSCWAGSTTQKLHHGEVHEGERGVPGTGEAMEVAGAKRNCRNGSLPVTVAYLRRLAGMPQATAGPGASFAARQRSGRLRARPQLCSVGAANCPNSADSDSCGAGPEGRDPSDGSVRRQEGEDAWPALRSPQLECVCWLVAPSRDSALKLDCCHLQAVIVKNYDDGDKNTDRSYGHALVVGLSKEPRKVGGCGHGWMILRWSSVPA